MRTDINSVHDGSVGRLVARHKLLDSGKVFVSIFEEVHYYITDLRHQAYLCPVLKFKLSSSLAAMLWLRYMLCYQAVSISTQSLEMICRRQYPQHRLQQLLSTALYHSEILNLS